MVVADLYYNVYYKEMLCKHQLLIFTTMFTMWEAEEQNMKQSFLIGPIVMNIIISDSALRLPLTEVLPVKRSTIVEGRFRPRA